MAALEEFLVVLKAQTSEFTGKLNGASNDLKKLENTGRGAFQKLAGVGKAALTGIAGAAIGVGIASVKMADDYEVAHARLVTALKNTGTSWDQQRKKIDLVEQSGEKLGFSMKDTEDALAIMTRGMGSSSKAIGALGVAQDLARAKGIDLATAATTVTRASEGQLRPLKQLGIDLPIAAGGALKVKKAQDALSKAWQDAAKIQEKIRTGHLKGYAAQQALAKSTAGITAAQKNLNDVQSTGGQILAALGAKLSGSAAAQAQTFGGKMQALKVQLQDVGVRIGLWLIPKLELVATVMQKVIGWFEKHKTVAAALGAVIGGALLVAVAAYTVAMVQAAAATIAATWPLLAVIAAIGLLVAAVVFLWQNWDKVMNFIAHHKALAVVIGILVPIIPVLIAIVGAVKFLYDHWSQIWPQFAAIAQTAAAVLSTVWDAITTGATAVGDFFKNFPERVRDGLAALPGLIGQALVDLGATLLNAFTTALNLLAAALPHLGQAVLFYFIDLPFLIVGGMIDLAGLLINLYQSAITALVGALPGMGASILNFFRQLPGWIIQADIAIGNMLINLFASALSALAGALPGLALGVARFFIDLPGNIARWASGIFGEMIAVGEAIVNGIIVGLGDIGGAIWDHIAGGLGGVVDKVKHFLGISSPSKVFAEIGGNVMRGFVVGVDDQKQSTIDHVGKVSAKITAAGAHGSFTSAATQVPSSAARGGGTNVYLTVNSSSLDPRAAGVAVEDAVRRALENSVRRTGPLKKNTIAA